VVVVSHAGDGVDQAPACAVGVPFQIVGYQFNLAASEAEGTGDLAGGPLWVLDLGGIDGLTQGLEQALKGLGWIGS